METFSSTCGDGKKKKKKAPMRDGDEQEKPRRPEWLNSLLQTKLFEACPEHSDHWTNAYCTSCDRAFCKVCRKTGLPIDHSEHQVLKIHRSSQQNGVSVSSMENLQFDCSMIKQLTCNIGEMVLLNPNTKLRPLSGGGCEECHRSMTLPFRFCSIACKIIVEDRAEGVDSEVPDQIPESLQQRGPQDLNSPSSSRDNCSSMESKESASSDSSSPSTSSGSNAPNLRNRKRKGEPLRSPMF